MERESKRKKEEQKIQDIQLAENRVETFLNLSWTLIDCEQENPQTLKHPRKQLLMGLHFHVSIFSCFPCYVKVSGWENMKKAKL